MLLHEYHNFRERYAFFIGNWIACKMDYNANLFRHLIKLQTAYSVFIFLAES